MLYASAALCTNSTQDQRRCQGRLALLDVFNASSVVSCAYLAKDIVEPLLSEYDFLNLSIPAAFSTRVSNALIASPTFVKLANLNHFWYSFGLRISDLLEDNLKLQQSLRLAFSQRLIDIFDLGQYEGNVDEKGFDTEFKAGMDELEKQRGFDLLETGYD